MLDPLDGPDPATINNGMTILKSAIKQVVGECEITSYSITAISDDGDYSVSLRGITACNIDNL